MKKFPFIIIGVVICVALCSKGFTKSPEKEIRIRVIANSNSEADQEIKKEIVKYLSNIMPAEFDSYEQADIYLKDNYKTIEALLLKKFNNIKVSYTIHNFANKAYDNVVLENQAYQTLLIEVGLAAGDNWWGSIFPYRNNTGSVSYEWYFGKYL